MCLSGNMTISARGEFSLIGDPGTVGPLCRRFLPYMNRAEAERPDDFLAWRSFAVENPIYNDPINACLLGPCLLAPGFLHLGAKQENDIFGLKYLHDGRGPAAIPRVNRDLSLAPDALKLA